MSDEGKKIGASTTRPLVPKPETGKGNGGVK